MKSRSQISRTADADSASCFHSRAGIDGEVFPLPVVLLRVAIPVLQGEQGPAAFSWDIFHGVAEKEDPGRFQRPRVQKVLSCRLGPIHGKKGKVTSIIFRVDGTFDVHHRARATAAAPGESCPAFLTPVAGGQRSREQTPGLQALRPRRLTRRRASKMGSWQFFRNGVITALTIDFWSSSPVAANPASIGMFNVMLPRMSVRRKMARRRKLCCVPAVSLLTERQAVDFDRVLGAERMTLNQQRYVEVELHRRQLVAEIPGRVGAKREQAQVPKISPGGSFLPASRAGSSSPEI